MAVSVRVAPLPPHFCILPWVHAYVTPSGLVSPCSKIAEETFVYGDLGVSPLREIWHGARAEDFRRAVLASSQNPLCSFCNAQDRAGIPAYRSEELRQFPDDLLAQEWTRGPDLAGRAKPRFLEFRFSDLCNFRCRTCHPSFSTGWQMEGEDVYGTSASKLGTRRAFRSRKELESFLAEIGSDLRMIQILGGEPLIQDEVYWLLEHLVDTGMTDVSLSITTNLSRLSKGNWNLLDLAQSFRNLSLTVSIDAIGRQAEYLRKGCRWKELEKNLLVWKVMSGRGLTVYPVVSVLNAFEFPRLLDWLIEKGVLSDKAQGCGLARFNAVLWPHYYDIRILNEGERDLLRRQYARYLEELRTRTTPRLLLRVEEYLRSILSFLDSGRFPERRSEFRRITRLLDRSRRESLPELFPELSGLYSESDQATEQGVSGR